MKDDIRVQSIDEWGISIHSLKEARDLMELAGNEMRKIVSNSLTQTGITGATGAAILKAYEEDVLVTIKNFILEVDSFIKNNERAKELTEGSITKIRNRVKAVKDYGQNRREPM